MKKLNVLLPVLMIMFFATTVVAQEDVCEDCGRSGRGYGRAETKGSRSESQGREKGDFAEKMKDELGLTDEQCEALKACKEDRKCGPEEMKGAYEARKELYAAIGSEPIDMDLVNELHSKSKVLDAERSDQRLQSMLDLRKILTAEQFTKMKEHMKSKGGHRGKGSYGHKKGSGSEEGKGSKKGSGSE